MTKVFSEKTDAAYSATVPVVTTLLASLSVALLIVPLASPTSPRRKLEFPPITADQIVVTAGMLAATLFVAASVCCIYGAATEAPTEKLKWYKFANLWWVYGLPLLLLTSGALASRQVSWLLPASGLAAALILATGDPMNKRWLAIVPAIGLFATVISGLAI